MVLMSLAFMTFSDLVAFTQVSEVDASSNPSKSRECAKELVARAQDQLNTHPATRRNHLRENNLPERARTRCCTMRSRCFPGYQQHPTAINENKESSLFMFRGQPGFPV